MNVLVADSECLMVPVRIISSVYETESLGSLA